MNKSRILGAFEIVLLAVFGLIALLSLIGVLISLIPDAATGRVAWSTVTLCLGPVVASVGSMLMIWLRNRSRGVSAPLMASVPLWFVGSSLLGLGLFVLFAPSDDPFLTNLGFSVALCLTPGGVFTALGLGAYWYAATRGGLKEALMRQAVEAPQAVFSQALLAADQREETLKRAAEYRANILALLRQRPDVAATAGPLAAIPAGLETWEKQVRRLVDRLVKLETAALNDHDRREAPAQIAALEAQLAEETDAAMQRQLAETLAGRREQQAQLDARTTLMRRTRLQLDESLAAMGTLYSQLQVMAALEIDGRLAARLTEDINRQTAQLAALLAAMAETRPALQTGVDQGGMDA